MKVAALAYAACDKPVVEQQDRLVWRGRALERDGEHGQHHPAAAERRQFVAQPLGACDRVVLEPSVGEAGCRGDVVVCTEGDDDDVGVVNSSIGDDVPRPWVNRKHPLLAELHARRADLAVRDPHLFRVLAPEEDLQLGEAEHEGVVLVEQSDLDLAGEALR